MSVIEGPGARLLRSKADWLQWLVARSNGTVCGQRKPRTRQVVRDSATGQNQKFYADNKLTEPADWMSQRIKNWKKVMMKEGAAKAKEE